MTTILFFLPFLLIYTLLVVYAERKVSAFIQDRYGPMETGYYGIIQTAADILKLLQKEDIIPAAADRRLFLMGPLVIFAAIFTGFSLMPLSPGWAGSGASSGVFMLLAIISVDVLGVLMAGWGSNSKFALYGSMRAIAQIISYEVPLGLSVLSVAVLCQSLSLQDISMQQSLWIADAAAPGELSRNYLCGLPELGINITGVGGFLSWNIVRAPFLFFAWLIFFIAGMAESNRVPFDLSEAESELISGFHTEYSGFRWSIMMLAEYAMMMLLGLLGIVLFLGSWNTPLPNIGPLELATWTSGTPGELSGYIWGVFWLISKVILLIFIQIWIRFTYPRLRVDQLMSLCWKYLTPAALVLLVLTAVWRILMIS